MTLFAVRELDELLNIRFAWSPVWETIAAVRCLRDARSPELHAWLSSRAAGLDLEPLLAAQPPRGYVPDFLSPPPRQPSPRLSDQLSEIRATEPDRVAHELARAQATPESRAQLAHLRADPTGARDRLAELIATAYAALVAPLWHRVEELLDREIVDRSRTLARHGLQTMLDEIHPSVRWVRGGLSVRNHLSDTVRVGDRGLLLIPSAYIWPRVALTVEASWQPAIAYPARGIAELWDVPGAPTQALRRLLGSSRASVLSSLDRPRSTTALARLLTMSPAGVSRHLLALRDARLVSGTRHGHEIRYAHTRLGAELVRVTADPEGDPSRT